MSTYSLGRLVKTDSVDESCDELAKPSPMFMRPKARTSRQELKMKEAHASAGDTTAQESQDEGCQCCSETGTHTDSDLARPSLLKRRRLSNDPKERGDSGDDCRCTTCGLKTDKSRTCSCCGVELCGQQYTVVCVLAEEGSGRVVNSLAGITVSQAVVVIVTLLSVIAGEVFLFKRFFSQLES